jgi:hypothetical protein
MWIRTLCSQRRTRRPASKPALESLEDRAVPTTSAVVTFGGNAQHTSIYQPAAQELSSIHWQTPVDLNPQHSGSDLLIHYGAPLMTSANTVLVPVKTGATGGFEVNAFNGATGASLYSLSTDYILPSHSWTPEYAPALVQTGSGTRLYYAGAGGTVYYITNPDSGTPGTPVQQVFYTTLANYQANAGSFNSTVFIDTPLTSDASGDVFFGFRVQGTAPAPLSTAQSGYARIDPSGNATYVLAHTAAGDANIAWDSHNAAAALSNDGNTLYVVVKSATSSSDYGYLLGLDSTTLATKYKVPLMDPRNNNANWAGILDDGTASPLVAPDGTVFLGVMGNPYNGSRGFTLHFSADLTHEFLPGAFGWDDTDAIVPASMVPAYTGPSSYLLFTKYNNYSAVETGGSGGNGINQVAILDPSSAETDARNDGAPTLQVMREVLTAPGPTPDPPNISSSTPEATREWCINTAAVDPASGAIFFPSEDGNLYGWCTDGNSLMEVIPLTAGIGEAYVPTVIGPDGTIYSINNAILFAIGNQTGQSVSLTSSAPSLQSAVAGQPLTFTAAVTNTSGSGLTPTGSITFKDGSTVLATVPLDATGHASYTTSSLPTNPTYPWATHFISAVYSGDSHFSAGTAELNQTVHESATTTSLTSSPGPSSFGQAVTFTATVTPAVSGLGGFTGMVTFEEGTNVLGQTPVSSSGVETFTTTALGVGSHTITAVYYSDPVYATSSGNDSANPQVVQQATTTTVGSSPNPSVIGQSVTVTALVASQNVNAGNPSGTVTFTEGSTTLASGVVVDATGHASFTTTGLAVGSHTITATFTGTAGWVASSGNDSASPQVVSQDATTTGVASSGNPSTYGDGVTFTATVSAAAPGSGTPTGTVTIYDGSTALGNGTLSAAGQAVFTTSALGAGTHSITAVYGGDGSFTGSTSAALSQGVNAATLTVTAGNAARVVGQPNPTFTDTITGFVNGDYASVVSGSASLTTTATSTSPAGTYPIVASQGTLSAANYTFAFVNGTLTVYPVPTASLSGPVDGVAYQSRTFTFMASGAPADESAGFTYQIDWGDGSPAQTVPATANNTSVTETHTYTATGTFPVSVTATDQFNAASAPATGAITVGLAQVQADAAGQGGITGLAISGVGVSSGVVLAPGATAGTLKVTRSGTLLGTFTPTNGNVAVYGDGGSDPVTVNGVSTSANSFTLSGSTATFTAASLGANVFTIGLNNISTITIVGGKAGNSFTNTGATVASVLKGASGGPNTFTFAGGGMGAAATVQGGGTSNTLLSPDQANAWTISGAGAGNLNGSGWSFTGVQNLVGGSGSDVFQFQAGGSVAGTIDGAGGANTLDYSGNGGHAATVNLQTGTATFTGGFRNIQNLVGSTAAVDGLVGANTANIWNVFAANAGNVNGTFTFAGVEKLTGGTGADTFAFGPSGSLTGAVNGGGGADTLDYSGDGGRAVTVNLQTHKATLTGGFSNIVNLVGSGAVANSLVGANATNTWHITGADAGDVDGSFTFSAVATLTGGTGVDAFAFGPAGTVAGLAGGGAPTGQGDWLDYTAYGGAVTVNLATGKATGVTGTVSKIQNVFGGNFGNTLTGSSQGNILIGGSGADTIKGGSGRNLLIGGLGNEQVTGGSADDIVIGGYTTYDQAHNEAALMSILAEWQSKADSYATRIGKLRGGSYPLAFGTTVLDDGGANTLAGGAGMDWFFQGAGDTITDLQSGEQVN